MTYTQSMTWKNGTVTTIVVERGEIVVTDTSERLEGGSKTSRYTSQDVRRLMDEHYRLNTLLSNALAAAVDVNESEG